MLPTTQICRRETRRWAKYAVGGGESWDVGEGQLCASAISIECNAYDTGFYCFFIFVNAKYTSHTHVFRPSLFLIGRIVFV